MYMVILMTASSKKEGKKIIQKLLEERLIACGNILDSVTSLFWWEGKINKSKEALCVLKTKAALFSRVEKRIKALHSYEVPEIIGLPIQEGSSAYLRWIDETLKGK